MDPTEFTVDKDIFFLYFSLKGIVKHLSILIPNGQNNISSIIGTYKIFKKANEFIEQKGGEPIFQVQMVGLNKELDMYDGLFTIRPHMQLSEILQTDLILIPAAHYNFQLLLKENKEIIDFIKVKYQQGAEVASICTGAFILAATGLLEGKNCSTHWNAVKQFREMFPNVTVLPDKLITDENGLYTNGGAFSFLNLLLYLVEKYYDRQTAIYCSKIFQIEINRTTQSPFIIFAGQKDHEDELIKKAQIFIEEKFKDKLSMETLASQFAASRRNFDRRFIKATGNTPLEYYQRVKIEFAKKMFESSRQTVNEVMYESGYSDTKAFREIFRKITGMLPLDYKNKYNKMAFE